MRKTSKVLQASKPAAYSWGEYTGPVRHAHWQVLELGKGLNIYTVYDRQTFQLLRDSRGTLHFPTIGQAEDYIDQLAGVKTTKKERQAKAAAPKVSKPSAASMFRDLILAGGLTDDEIFAKVKEAFKLDDSRRSYVDWYRKDLKKKGLL